MKLRIISLLPLFLLATGAFAQDDASLQKEIIELKEGQKAIQQEL